MALSIGIQVRRGVGRPIARSAAALMVAAWVSASGLQPVSAADEGAIWDYRTIFVVWDDEAQDWRADWTEGPSTVGLEAVLDGEGAVGWELIDITPEVYDTVAIDGTDSQQARRLRLTFKQEGTAAVAAPVVAISGFSFGPASLDVAAGTTVRWENQDPTAHTVTSDDGTFDSGVLPPGEAFEQTFDSPGTFGYACAIHPSMTGTIVVS